MADKENNNELKNSNINEDDKSNNQRKLTGKEKYDLHYIDYDKSAIKFLAIALVIFILLFILTKFLSAISFPDSDFLKKASGILLILSFASIVSIIQSAISMSMWESKLKVDTKQAVKLENLKKQVQGKEYYLSQEDNDKYKETIHSYQMKAVIYYLILFLFRIIETTIKNKGIIKNFDITIQKIIYMILYLIMAICTIIGTIYLIKIFVFMAKENKKIKDETKRLKEEEKRIKEEKQNIENKIE